MTTRFAVLSLLFALLTASAAAQSSAGARVGVSANPDQFYFGGQIETRLPLVDNLHFRPNVELGVGDHATVIALNFELAYKFPTGQAWQPYVAAGPALIIVDTDRDTSSGGGFNFALGVEHRGGLFGELKTDIGEVYSPNFKIGIGYNFK